MRLGMIRRELLGTLTLLRLYVVILCSQTLQVLCRNVSGMLPPPSELLFILKAFLEPVVFFFPCGGLPETFAFRRC
jgi:hypothetical protein